MSEILEQAKSNDPPDTYRKWQRRASELLVPLCRLIEPGRAFIPIKGRASNHGLLADRLESVVRPLLLFAHWRYSLNRYRESSAAELAEPMERWFSDAILLGTNPESEEFWGWPCGNSQHTIEIGALIIALELSRGWMWASFTELEREQVLNWIGFEVDREGCWNKSLFSGILAMEFLLREGAGNPAFRPLIDEWFSVLEGMYLGGGWFMDGMHRSVDFYNAYSWHYYSLWWIRLFGDSETDRCRRWEEYTRLFLEKYPLFFSANGEHPAFGRSITYRFNASAPIGLAQLLGISPLQPGLARKICERNLDFFLNKPIFQEQECLSLGWFDHFEEATESYSCGSSPYWAAKAFSPLLIPSSDPYWTAPSTPLPSEISDECAAFRDAGLIVRAISGEVEIINAGSQAGRPRIDLGTWKWGRLSYRTGMGYLIVRDPDNYPLDGGLTASPREQKAIWGRHLTYPVEVSRDKMSCRYDLGAQSNPSQISVETHMWWKSGWQLILHRYECRLTATLRHGSYAISTNTPNAFESRSIKPHYSSVWTDAGGIALQSLCGKGSFGSHGRPDDSAGQREHIQAPYHSMRCLEFNVETETGLFACLNWAGTSKDEAQPWEVESVAEGLWKLFHPDLGAWHIEDPVLPQLG